MAKKRTKAQKKSIKRRIIETPVKSKTKKVFFDQEKNFIINDLKKTSLYTLIIIAVLLMIFVYTKTS
jgi:hypothetical protein